MANLFVTLPAVVNAAGAGVDVSQMGARKTLAVDGTFNGVLMLEASLDAGVTWTAVQAITGVGKKVVTVAAEQLRIRSQGAIPLFVPFAPSIDLGASDAGGQFAQIPAPAANAAGAPVDVSTFGQFTTWVVNGPFTGALDIEISEDGVDYVVCRTITAPGTLFSKSVVANWMRARSRGATGAIAPVISVGAVDDAGSGASPSGTIVSNCYIYQPSGAAPGSSGPVVYSDWSELYTALDAARTLANGDGCWSIEFDDSLDAPISVPVAGMPVTGWDMTGVEWMGRAPGSGSGGGGLLIPGEIRYVSVEVEDGVLLPGLRRLRGLLEVQTLSPATSPVVDLVQGDVVYMSDGAALTAGAVAPFFDAVGLLAGEGFEMRLWNGAKFLGRDVLVQLPNLANTYLVMRLGTGVVISQDTIGTGALALLFMVLESPAVAVGPQGAVLGADDRVNPDLFYRTAATPPVLLVDGANVQIVADDGDYFFLFAGALGTRQLDAPINSDPAFRRTIVLEFEHGGVEALTFDAAFDFGDPGPPSYPAAGNRDIITMIFNGVSWLCSYVQGYA